MSYELSGEIVNIGETIARTETFKTREFVVKKHDVIGDRDIYNFVKFQTIQDKTLLLNNFSLGDAVKVYFNIKGSEWNKNGITNYITNLDAWRIEKINTSTNNTPPPSFQTNQVPTIGGKPTQNTFDEYVDDDLPF